MKNVDLHHGASSDVGLVRKVNEDSFLVAPPVFVVADGMGGHSGGDVASQMVVEEFQRLAEAYDPARGAEQVADAFARAQARIIDFGNAHRAMTPGWHAGTTAVVAVLVDDNGVAKWLLANLGDSRIYRITDGRLEQISVDHSVVQELIDSGQITVEEAAIHPERHVITRALGSPEGIEPDFFLLPLGSVGAAAAVQRRRHRDDRGQGDRGDPRERRRPARRRRPAGAGGRGRGRSGQRDGRRRRCGGIGEGRQL